MQKSGGLREMGPWRHCSQQMFSEVMGWIVLWGAVKEGEGENVFLHLGSLCLHLSSPVSPVLTPAVPRTLVLDDAV